MDTIEMTLANETRTADTCRTIHNSGEKNAEKILHDLDRRLFINNLGILLSQTREEIYSCCFDAEADAVTVYYKNGSTRRVNVAMDSYLAIIRDVCRSL